jgi:cyclase
MLNYLRIVPKLEIHNQKLIKGIQYEGLKNIGDPRKFALKYYRDGADQINIVDVMATLFSRNQILEIINDISNEIFVPICVGGGVRSIEDIENLLNNGVDRISLNTILFEKFNLISKIRERFGSQIITISLEVKEIEEKYFCFTNRGRDNTGITLESFLNKIKNYEFCEIIINSIEKDGMLDGIDKKLKDFIKPNINKYQLAISGGITDVNDIIFAKKEMKIDSAIISSALHFDKVRIKSIKEKLIKKKFKIRM